MRLPDPNLPSNRAVHGPLTDLINALDKWLKLVQKEVNALSDGSISGYTSANISPPPVNSVTTYAAGDFIRNVAPSVMGTAGSEYVILGWVCTKGGTPGTWTQCRSATGG